MLISAKTKLSAVLILKGSTIKCQLISSVSVVPSQSCWLSLDNQCLGAQCLFSKEPKFYFQMNQMFILKGQFCIMKRLICDCAADLCLCFALSVYLKILLMPSRAFLAGTAHQGYEKE